jgi:hypothetical protein
MTYSAKELKELMDQAKTLSPEAQLAFIQSIQGQTSPSQTQTKTKARSKNTRATKGKSWTDGKEFNSNQVWEFYLRELADDYPWKTQVRPTAETCNTLDELVEKMAEQDSPDWWKGQESNKYRKYKGPVTKGSDLTYEILYKEVDLERTKTKKAPVKKAPAKKTAA